MKHSQRVLLLGSAGYLGRILTTLLQQSCSVVPTHRTDAYFAGSLHYDFWTDDINPLVEYYGSELIIIAANMAYEAAGEGIHFTGFQQRAECLIQGCRHRRVIYISSDGIFNGKKGNYIETDIPTPSTQYGKNLKYLEERVQALCSNYCIIRPSYLYGYSLSQLDSRLTLIRERLLAREHLTYFTDMMKSPMEVNQVAKAISWFALSNYIGIVHVAGPTMSIYDFAWKAMQSLGVPCDQLQPSIMPPNFPHPRDTSLDSSLMKKLTSIEPVSIDQALKRKE